MEPVKVRIPDFKADVEKGLTRKELKEKYSLSLSSIKEIAKKLNLEIKRDVKPKFELIDDVTPTNQITLDQAIVEAETVNSLND